MAVCVDFGLLWLLPESCPSAGGDGLHGGRAQPTVLASLLCPHMSLSLGLYAGGCGSECKSGHTGRLSCGRRPFLLYLLLNLSPSLSCVVHRGGGFMRSPEEETPPSSFPRKKKGLRLLLIPVPLFFCFVARLIPLILLA